MSPGCAGRQPDVGIWTRPKPYLSCCFQTVLNFLQGGCMITRCRHPKISKRHSSFPSWIYPRRICIENAARGVIRNRPRWHADGYRDRCIFWRSWWKEGRTLLRLHPTYACLSLCIGIKFRIHRIYPEKGNVQVNEWILRQRRGSVDQFYPSHWRATVYNISWFIDVEVSVHVLQAPAQVQFTWEYKHLSS